MATRGFQHIHKHAVCFDSNVICRAIRKERGLPGVDIWVEQNLRQRVRCYVYVNKMKIYSTWLAAGLILAEASNISRWVTSKLLTPILLQIFRIEVLKIYYGNKHVLNQALVLERFHPPPSGWNIRKSEVGLMDKIQVNVT